ncbi:hypothetical protein Ancab_012695, partial [Ancistrocladus abbreviatus]
LGKPASETAMYFSSGCPVVRFHEQMYPAKKWRKKLTIKLDLYDKQGSSRMPRF